MPSVDSTSLRVLVTYASRFGSTRDVAARIGERLRAHGHDVTLRAVDDTSSARGYDAVVLGSGVYDGAWTDAATTFISREARTLDTMPVWLFSVGSFGDRHSVIGGLVRREPREIDEVEQAVHPRDYRVFAGVIDLTRWPAWARLLFQAFGGRDGDNRSWPDIEAWAEEIAEALDREAAAHGLPRRQVRP